MEGCQSDFGSCGEAGIHLPISSDPTAINVSSTSSAKPGETAMAIDQKINHWTIRGCWTESNDGRALSSRTLANDAMSLNLCAEFCNGFQMFGVEYGRECKPLLLLF